MTPRRTVLALAIAAWLVSGCVAQGSSLDDKQAPTAVPRNTVTETHTDVTAPAATADTGAASSALQCHSSSSGRCVYVPEPRPFESQLDGINRAPAGLAANDDSVASTPPSLGAPPSPFVGMWDFDPDGDGDLAQLCGYLIIEEPYVHVLATDHDWGQGVDPGLFRDDDGRLQYYMIMLPRPGTRYDPDTRSLWVYDEGPMTDGDHVSASGGQGHRHPNWGEPDLHQRNVWRANGMGPAHYPCR